MKISYNIVIMLLVSLQSGCLMTANNYNRNIAEPSSKNGEVSRQPLENVTMAAISDEKLLLCIPGHLGYRNLHRWGAGTGNPGKKFKVPVYSAPDSHSSGKFYTIKVALQYLDHPSVDVTLRPFDEDVAYEDDCEIFETISSRIDTLPPAQPNRLDSDWIETNSPSESMIVGSYFVWVDGGKTTLVPLVVLQANRNDYGSITKGVVLTPFALAADIITFPLQLLLVVGMKH